MIMSIENTTYSGVGKPVYDYFNPSSNKELVDWKGRNIVPHEEYYVFLESDIQIIVIFDDCEKYLFGSYGNYKNQKEMIEYVYEEYGILPEIIIK